MGRPWTPTSFLTISYYCMSRHLLTVWSPSFAKSIMGARLEVLMGWAERHRDGKPEAARRYVWWAKLNPPNCQQPLPTRPRFWPFRSRLTATRRPISV